MTWESFGNDSEMPWEYLRDSGSVWDMTEAKVTGETNTITMAYDDGNILAPFTTN